MESDLYYTILAQHKWILLLFIFSLSFTIVFFTLPQVISVAIKKKLYDEYLETRKVHRHYIPNLGGIAIMIAFIFSSMLFIPHLLIPEWRIIIAAGLLTFMMGLKDDLVGLSPIIKINAQFITASIVSICLKLQVAEFYHLFADDIFNIWIDLLITSITIVFLINAFNLIDGIDGLAGSIGIFYALCFAYLFYTSGDFGWSMLTLSLAGALTAFLFYNLTPSKIFMGNSGSYLIGFFAATFGLRLYNLSLNNVSTDTYLQIQSCFALIASILFIPIYDTIRVMVLRITQNVSIFKADSNHIHHRLLSAGCTHIQATIILLLTNIFLVSVAVYLQNLGNLSIILIITSIALSLNGILYIYLRRKVNLVIDEEAGLLTPKG